MDWLKTLWKSLLGFLTFQLGSIVADPSIITNLIPENIANLTVGGLAAALVVGVVNWFKHRND